MKGDDLLEGAFSLRWNKGGRESVTPERGKMSAQEREKRERFSSLISRRRREGKTFLHFSKRKAQSLCEKGGAEIELQFRLGKRRGNIISVRRANEPASK